MLSLGCEKTTHPLKKKKKKKKKKTGCGSLPSPRSGYATTITVYFCSFTHLTIPRSPPKFNQFFLVLLGPVHKISSQSVHNFLSNVVHRQTNRQTNATKNITFFAKEVIKLRQTRQAPSYDFIKSWVFLPQSSQVGWFYSVSITSPRLLCHTLI